MEKKFSIYLIIILLFLTGIVMGGKVENNSSNDLDKRFFKLLQSIATPRFDDSWKEREKLSYYLSQSKSLETKSYMPAIVALWDLGERSELELLWWKSNSRYKRTLILSCFLSLTNESGDMQKLEWFPHFDEYIHKFSKPEGELRRSEFIFVTKHKLDLARILNEMSKKNDSNQPSEAVR